MDGIPTSIAAGVSGAISVKPPAHQAQAARLGRQRRARERTGPTDAADDASDAPAERLDESAETPADRPPARPALDLTA